MASGQFPSANTAETTARYHKRKREAVERDSGPSVYELSNLQVDPYGLRVGSNSRPLQKPELDLRGNLIAYDAPRLSDVVPKPRREYLARISDRPVPFGKAAVDDEERDDDGSEDFEVELGKERNQRAPLPAGGRPKRQGSSTQSKFDFWDATTEVYEEPLLPRPSISGSPSSSSTPPPSADLINAIVHFSAEHYTERGQLHPKWPTPPQVLVRHRSKRTTRSQRKTKETSSDSESDPSENEAGTSKGDADKGKAKEAPPGHDPKESIVGYSSISMHRAFDGTAANVIGMIVQELIRENIHSSASPGASGTTGSQRTAKRKKRSTASRYVSPTRTLADRRMAESELAAQESDQEDSEREHGETEPEADMVDRDGAEAGATRKHLTRQSKIGKDRVRAGEDAESDDEASPTRTSRQDQTKRKEKTNASSRRVSAPVTSEDDRAALGEGDDDDDDDDDEEMALA